MCERDAKPTFSVSLKPRDINPSPVGSRRRRIWELPSNCHCPVIGVCLPLSVLRKLTNKVVGGEAVADDYEIHVGAIAECDRRNRLSETLQHELDRRYAQTIQRFRSAKTTEALAQLWRDAVRSGDTSGAFWAGLTHGCCDVPCMETLCRDMHMLQHQAGAGVRVDLVKFEALQKELAARTIEHERTQERSKRLLAEKQDEIQLLSSQLMQAHAARLVKDTSIASLQNDIVQLQTSIPDLEPRLRQKQKNEQMAARNRDLENAIQELKHKLAATTQQLNKALEAAVPTPDTREDEQSLLASEPVWLDAKTVLCVGGRTGNVASYRAHIERIGGQFMHHDGGLEDNVNLLEANLAAADLVICQTGCISHQAYWRVKDMCKRTGKRCVFVDNPSTAGLARGLEKMSVEEAAGQPIAQSEKSDA